MGISLTTMNKHSTPSELPSDDLPLDLEQELPESSLRILIANEQSSLAIDESLLEAAVRAVFRDSPYNAGCVSIAVVDDPTIHEINRQYLQHDYPTDVLSFVLEDRRPYLEGELVVSTDTAIGNAEEFHVPAAAELLLYVVHGALHLVGYRDKRADEVAEMRLAEAKYMRELVGDSPRNSWHISSADISNASSRKGTT